MHLYSVQAAIATLYDEVVIVRNTLDNANKERDKFRADIQVRVLLRKLWLQSIIRKHRKELKCLRWRWMSRTINTTNWNKKRFRFANSWSSTCSKISLSGSKTDLGREATLIGGKVQIRKRESWNWNTGIKKVKYINKKIINYCIYLRTFYEEKTNIENIQRKMGKELSTKIEVYRLNLF